MANTPIHPQQPTKQVAIVVPMSNRVTLTPDEKISYEHLIRHLGRYDRFLVLPRGLSVEFPGFGLKRFEDRYFGSAKAHSALMLSEHFYQAFAEYKFILLYHLDALAFSDQLEEWCGMDYDYIGAPWIHCKETPYVREPRVGCGGFSLRKTEACLKVLRSSLRTVDPDEYWARVYAAKPLPTRVLHFPRKILKALGFKNNVRSHIARWHSEGQPEDFFWSFEARRYYPEFRIAPVEAALRFSFEVAPRECFERNQRRLPFGCHAWPKYDRAFWEPYLLKPELLRTDN